MLLLLCSVLFCVIAILVLRQRIKESTAHKLPPVAMGGLPIVGHTLLLAGIKREDLWHLSKSLAEDSISKGGVTYSIFGTDLYYVITDPDDVQTAGNACLQKHYLYSFAKSWLGDGLVTSSGEIWSRHRKLIIPAFNLRILNGFLGVFNEQSRLLADDFANHCDKGPFDQSDYLRRRAIETFCSTAFGLSNYDDKDFIEKYMTAVDKILVLFAGRFMKFWLHSDWIYGLTAQKKKEDELIKTLNSMSDGVIQRKKAELLLNKTNTECPKLEPDRPQALLDLLLKLSDNDKLTDKEIREEVDTAILAGFDTSSTLMIFIVMVLGAYPRVQEKVYEELMQVVGPDRDVAKDDIQKLVYTEAVINETLRFYVLGPAVLRYVDKDVKLKNYTIRAGSQCVFMPYGTHTDPVVWGPDASDYKPERWLDPATVPENAFTGFSFGRKRSCIGKTFALMSMKVSIVHIIRRFRIRSSDLSNLKLNIDTMLKAISGHEISVVNRC